MTPLLRTLAVGTLLLGFTGCDLAKKTEIAGKAVTAFHQQLNNSKFTEIYSGSNSAMKTASSEAEFVKFLTAVRKKLGAFESGSQKGWRINSNGSGTQVILTYQSQFENGNAVETFTFVVSGDSASLQGYHVDSPALITN